MDLSANSGTLPTHSTVRGPASEQELSLSSARCPTESGGTILLQLLEFKSHLLEAVEELHIRRDAETRFEDHIGKLVLEKQELEWEKESLQNQIETLANEQTESLNNARKQFQAKIRNTEEEKGKYQVSAELKDKEINSLKEELKSLQLQKYNLEKKASELEQKLVLQTRTKDSHLNQLGEVEKRFSALSRQCAMVKQAHEKLEQNVDEALKRNKKLTSVNEKQEAAIMSLKKELEEVSNKLIKARMTSVRHDKTHIPTGTEQRMQQLHQRLNMEIEMNEKLAEENAAVRAEKQEVMRSLQHSQQLLLSQTQTISRVELELQTQREKYQALKQEHEVMREKSKAIEDKTAQLMESCAASRIGWDKEVRGSSQSLSVSTQLVPTSTEEVREEQTLNEPISSSELPHFDSVQHLASIQTKNPDCLEDTGAVTKLVTTGATGGQDIPNHHQQSQCSNLNLNPLNPFTCLLTNNKLFGLCCTSGTSSSGSNKNTTNSYTSGSDPDALPGLIHTTSPVSDDCLLSSKGSRMSEKEKELKQGQTNTEEEEINEEQQLNGEVQGEDVKEGGSAGEKRGTLAQTTDSTDRRGGGSTGDAGDTKKLETETKDRAGTYGAEESRKIGLHMTETQIATQTATDATAKKSNARRGIDLMVSEPPVAACHPSDSSPSLSQRVGEKDADSCHVNKGCEIRTEVLALRSDQHQSVSRRPNFVIREMQRLCHSEVKHFSQDAESVTHLHHQDFEKTVEDKPSDTSAADALPLLSEPVNQSVCSPQSNTEPSAAHSDSDVSIQETIQHTQPSYPSDVTSGMMQTDEMCVPHVSEERLLMRTKLEPPASPESHVVLEQESGGLESLIRDGGEDDDGDSSLYKKEGQSNADSHFNNACGNGQEKSNLRDSCADITMDPVELESDAKSGGLQQHMENKTIEDIGDAKTTKRAADLKLSVHPSHENDAPPETGGTTCREQTGAKEKLLNDANEPCLSSKTHTPSLDWSKAQRKTVSSRTKSDMSVLHQFVQGSHMSEQNIKGSGGLFGHPPSTIPLFLRGKHNKVPLVITSASDLLNASSVCGTAASSRRQQQGETATADTESKAVSTSSVTVSTLSWQTTPGCSRAPASASGVSSDSEPSCSQEREDQQTSLRAHISKIEKFLDTERLRLPKRRRTDN